MRVEKDGMLLAAGLVAGMAMAWLVLSEVPYGWEDEDGFHYGVDEEIWRD